MAVRHRTAGLHFHLQSSGSHSLFLPPLFGKRNPATIRFPRNSNQAYFQRNSSRFLNFSAISCRGSCSWNLKISFRITMPFDCGNFFLCARSRFSRNFAKNDSLTAPNRFRIYSDTHRSAPAKGYFFICSACGAKDRLKYRPVHDSFSSRNFLNTSSPKIGFMVATK